MSHETVRLRTGTSAPAPPRPSAQADGADRPFPYAIPLVEFIERYLDTRLADHHRAIVQLYEDGHTERLG